MQVRETHDVEEISALAATVVEIEASDVQAPRALVLIRASNGEGSYQFAVDPALCGAFGSALDAAENAALARQQEMDA